MRPTIASSAAFGAAFGALTSVVNAASSPYTSVGSALHEGPLGAPVTVVSLLLDAGWAWAALAVAVGAFCVAWRLALVGATLALLAASVAYFAVDAPLQQVSFASFRGEALFWVAASLVFGPVLGVVGALARRPDLVGLLARLVVPLGALIQMERFGDFSTDALGVRPEEVVATWLVVAGGVVAIAVLAARFVRQRADARRAAPSTA